MTSLRDKIIETISGLLESQGYHATGLNQIVRESGAPKGSLYHYFPGGKEEMAAAAIIHSGRQTAERIRAGLRKNEDTATAFRTFISQIADGVEISGFRAGGPLTIVAMETAGANESLNLACRQAYQALQEAFIEKLIAGGYTPARAAELAAFITASIEGGIILSRTAHSGDPLRRVADEVSRLLEQEKHGA